MKTGSKTTIHMQKLEGQTWPKSKEVSLWLISILPTKMATFKHQN